MTLLEKIQQGFVFFDGGYGTILQAKGLKAGELPETYNILQPEMITDIHYEYLMAGSQILKTNTFGCNALKFSDEGEFSLENLVCKGVENARAAITKAGKVQGEDAYIALDLGPTGKLLEPLGDLPFEKAVQLYAQVTEIGVKCGVDCVLIETMNDGYEAKAAVLGVKENCDLPVFVTTVYDETGKSLTGSGPKNMVALLEGLGVDALGLNCSLGPKKMLPIVQEICENASVPVIANPNAGLPKVVDGKTVFEVDADEFAEEMTELVKA
ncbi:MAG: homocysteine S-methyltransferase family protein, partial [Lachnospiraceae bacterium]|nr:homocysteine S-methyltransferase family protein [Lachnospiraceae bacterium]